MDHAPKVLVWNVRGLNARARRTAIRSLVVTTNASIACFQETKMQLVCSSVVLETARILTTMCTCPRTGPVAASCWHGRVERWPSPILFSPPTPCLLRSPPRLASALHGGSPLSTGPNLTTTRLPSCKSSATFATSAPDCGCCAGTSTSYIATRTKTTGT
uniref:Endonuclease/exonuclease/phosphatase domain-containing protein n=1 Tax=Aegilops tauschii subsp. strangulata TaxID=200361 RepID=A0A452Z0F0_AEGTS